MSEPQTELKQQEITTNIVQTISTFQELNLHKDLLRGIYGYGFEKPSLIQQKGILPIIKGKDTIAQAQSGTGKTATFSIGLLSRIDPKSSQCQALILAPTRELAKQIQKVIMCLGQHLNIVCYSCIGGTNINQEKKILKEGGIHIVVGTPGRVRDMMEKRNLKSTYFKILVLDQADQMLGRGFFDQIKDIIAMLPIDMQITLFSATMPPQIIQICQKFMNKPQKILIRIKQYYIAVQKDQDKVKALYQIYANVDIGQCIIYCNYKVKVDELSKILKTSNFVVSSMHGGTDQEERNLIMKEFRTGSSRVLITTDLLSRGIDIQQINLVINYDLPFKIQSYIHRIGRSGRFGKKGVAINLVLVNDSKNLKEIEAFYQTQIKEMPSQVDKLFG